MPDAATDPRLAAEPRRWGLGEVALGFFAAQVGGFIASSIVLAASGRTVDQFDDLPLGLVALAQLGLWAGLLGAVLFATRAKGDGVVADLGFRARWDDVWRGAGVGIALQLVVLPLLYWPLLEALDKSFEDLEGPAQTLTDRANDPLGVLLLVLIVGIGAPVVEELFYRGLFQGALLKRGLSPGVSIGVTSVVFGASHMQLLQLPALVVAGAAFGVLAYRAGRLGPAIAAHVAFNLFTVVYLLAG